jgi:hypothetical protein
MSCEEEDTCHVMCAELCYSLQVWSGRRGERSWGVEKRESASEKREQARELESRKKNTVGDTVGDEDLKTCIKRTHACIKCWVRVL